ncbi:MULTISPECIES: hypothetical protein [Heyndrickxia]|nr:hypothetical protein [Heyndrickxia shackletonii]
MRKKKTPTKITKRDIDSLIYKIDILLNDKKDSNLQKVKVSV